MTQIKTPKVSIIIPVYNAEKWLSRCLDSVLSQSFDSFEVLLVNDGSTDTSGEICDRYGSHDQRVHVIHQLNRGVSSARNTALDIAAGEYIAFCDADDEVTPMWLQDFVTNIGNADICLQGFSGLHTNGHVDNRIPDNLSGKNINAFLEYLMEVSLLGYCVTKLFRKSIIKEYNLKFDHSIRFREDDLFVCQYLEHANSWVSISKSNYIYYLPATDKKYGMDSTVVTEKLCGSIFNICKGMPSKIICKNMAWSIKGYAVSNILSGNRLSSQFLSFYNLFISKGCNNNFRQRIINSVIHASKYNYYLSRIILSGIHSLIIKAK